MKLKTCRVFFCLLDMLYVIAISLPFIFNISTVKSDAMAPYITTKDLVVTEKQETIHPGDVVIYKAGNGELCRRVVRVEDGTYVTKGDAVPTEDTLTFTEDDYVGTVVRVIPGGVALYDWLHSLWVPFALIVFTVVLFMY